MEKIDWNNFNSSLLIEVTKSNGVFTSTGVAISSDTILTAAHCFEGEILKVRVSNEASYDPRGHFYEVDFYSIHPEYNKENSNFRFDLAKIKLNKPLPRETKFYPIIKNDKTLTGKFFRLGFGAREKRNNRTLVTPAFRKIRQNENILELDDIFSYSGDSGGPIFLQKDGQVFLVAIHSTLSFGPDGKHSLNPLLSSHRDWIAREEWVN